MRRTMFLWVMSACAVLSACVSAPYAPCLEGMVYDTEGSPLSGVRIKATYQDSHQADMGASGANGRFSIPLERLGASGIELSFLQKGYRTETVQLASGASSVHAIHVRMHSSRDLLIAAEEAWDKQDAEKARALSLESSVLDPSFADAAFFLLVLEWVRIRTLPPEERASLSQSLDEFETRFGSSQSSEMLRRAVQGP